MGPKDTRDAPGDDPKSHRRQDANSQRAALLGILICLLLVLGGLVLVYKLKSMSDLQDCVMQGRSNCAPVEAASDK
ncbi:MAG TPA: hypothetical protein VK437_06930 [Steroidobacteraceae bacterium]|nr:hypothetical protein [Steroidobacteraceae bacterium]